MDFKDSYKIGLESLGNTLHFTAHSHHLWPDCGLEGQTKYWKDSATMTDTKWQHILEDVIPVFQKNLSLWLGGINPKRICYASSTHDHLIKILSSTLLKKSTLKVLTTDSEFHSFTRQINILQREGLIEKDEVAVSFDGQFEDNFLKAAKNKSYDFIFVSHVFYNSGYRVSDDFIMEVSKLSAPIIVVDGYHAVGSISVDLKDIEQRIFYLGGGYKYLQSGEGLGFMSVPDDAPSPLFSGWFAAIEGLETHQQGPLFHTDGRKYLGATFDPSGIYRFNSFSEHFKDYGPKGLLQFVDDLKIFFLDELEKRSPLGLKESLVIRDAQKCGHFLSFKTKDAQNLYSSLKDKGILTDYRDDVVRIGLGTYHNKEDIIEFFQRLS